MAYQKLENLLQITSDIHKSFTNITCYCRNARRDITQKSQPLKEIALEFKTFFWIALLLSEEYLDLDNASHFHEVIGNNWKSFSS